MATWLLVGSALCWVATGCGTEGGGQGGAAQLPNRGVEPYVPVVIDTDGDPETPGEPWVLRASGESDEEWTGPSAAVVDGRVALYWAVARSGGAEQEIVTALSGDSGVTWSPPRVVLTLDDVAELGAAPDQSGVASPAVLPGRGGEEWLLAFEFGARAGIGLARSPDGDAWAVDGALLVGVAGEEEEVGSPSLVRTDRGLEVFYDATLSDGRRVIRRALQVFETDDEGNDVASLRRLGTVLSPPAVDCVDAFGEVAPCWDRAGVMTPEVRWAERKSDGSRVYRMWYTGYDSSRGKIGFAASDGGQSWSRYATNPVIDSARDTNEPTNVFMGERYLLFYFDFLKSGEVGLSLAVNEEGSPSELF